MQMPPVFSPSLSTFIFSRYFLLNFYGNLQWTRRAFGIVAVIPGPTQFLMANNCQKVVRATRCGVRRCGVGFPARKFACSIGIVMRLRGYVKNEKCNLLDIATALVTSEGVSPRTTHPYGVEYFCNICQILYANLSVAAIKCNGIITCSSALSILPAPLPEAAPGSRLSFEFILNISVFVTHTHTQERTNQNRQQNSEKSK